MLKKDTRSGFRVARVSLYSELKKRKVFTTAAIYIPVAWLAAEIFIFLSDRLGAPHWVGDIIAVQFILGFPVCLVLAWLFTEVAICRMNHQGDSTRGIVNIVS